CSRTLTEPTHPRPRPPEELGLESILYEKAPPRATITLNRPEVLNAFDFRLLRELARACEDASWDDEIRVLVLTGRGRAFCVGARRRGDAVAADLRRRSPGPRDHLYVRGDPGCAGGGVGARQLGRARRRAGRQGGCGRREARLEAAADHAVCEAAAQLLA